MTDPGYRLRTREPITDALLDVVRARFGQVTADGTTLTAGGLDQAALRALLTLIWDAGHELVALEKAGTP